MIQLVHWQEQVPPDFMEIFERIEKSLITAKRFNRVNEEESSIEKKEPGNYEKWKKVRRLMRHSGYESIHAGKRILWCEQGWLGTAEVIKVDGKEELKFRYFANSPDPPLFISVAGLMKFKQEFRQDGIEDEYYNPDRYVKALSEKVNIRKRRDIDDFMPEIDD